MADDPKTTKSPAPAPAGPAPVGAVGAGPAPTSAAQSGEDVTYLPAAGDPVTTIWRGHAFKANVPKRLTDPAHLDAARANKFFRVGKGDPNKPDDHNPNDAPKTSQEYRAHVVAWIKTCDTLESVVKHWADDRALRQTCGVGSDDVAWLGTLVEPKLMEFKRREGMTDAAVAAVWVKYGFTEIPWRG